MLDLRSKKTGFTLIEAIISLGLLSLIAIFLIPSLSKLNENSNKFKDTPKIIFALQSAIENEKSNQDIVYGSKIEHINGYDIFVQRESYGDNLDWIYVNYDNYELEVLEVKDEKAWFHSYWIIS